MVNPYQIFVIFWLEIYSSYFPVIPVFYYCKINISFFSFFLLVLFIVMTSDLRLVNGEITSIIDFISSYLTFRISWKVECFFCFDRQFLVNKFDYLLRYRHEGEWFLRLIIFMFCKIAHQKSAYYYYRNTMCILLVLFK